MNSGGVLGLINTVTACLDDLNFISIVFRFFLAIVYGGMIGIDRGMKRRVAGVKTHTIVCIGATLAMMTGEYIHLFSNGAGIGDTARLGAQVISGVGFLGVGTIVVTGQRHVSGLTTAASLWSCSCIGLALGIGFYSGATVGTIAILIVLRYFKQIDGYVAEHSNVYEVYMEFESNEAMSAGILTLRNEYIKINNVMVIQGKTEKHNVRVQASVEAAKWMNKKTIFLIISELDGLISVEELW